MSLAFGGIIAYSSYLPRKNDCTKDAIVTSVINLVTSIFTVTVVFSILGFKATVTHDNCLTKFVHKSRWNHDQLL
jgi:SNF family Na+-dependent transporter